MMKKEESLQLSVCKYLKLQYPQVIFCCDFAAGIKLNIGQAVKASKMRSSRGLPDIMIFQPNKHNHGLFIELKTKSPYLKDGVTLRKDEHLEQQNEILNSLILRGYGACFAIGFDEAKDIIDTYLKDV